MRTTTKTIFVVGAAVAVLGPLYVGLNMVSVAALWGVGHVLFTPGSGFTDGWRDAFSHPRTLAAAGVALGMWRIAYRHSVRATTRS